MAAVKIKASDQYFSRCIRERAGWKCERCGAQHEEGSMGLHCSHFHGRGKWATRFDPDNCEALCYGCHMFVGSQPHEHEKRIREKLGSGLYEILLQKSTDSSLGRLAKREEAQIRKHYRAELGRMKELRHMGEVGRIEFDNWC